MRYTRTALGLLTRQYRSVLRKCWLINSGIWGWVMRTAATGAAAMTLGATVLPNEAEASGTIYYYNGSIYGAQLGNSYAWKTFVETSDLNGYATQTWVNNKGYITSSALNGYATTASLASASVNYANSAGSASSATNATNATYASYDRYGRLIDTTYLTSHQSLAGYATETWVNNKGYITSSALNGYATQTWVGQQGYLTSSSLSGYATQTWVGQQGYITASSLPTKTSQLTNDSGFITASSLPTKTSQLTNDSGFITKSVNDLTNYYTKLVVANDNTATTIFKKAI